MVDIQIIEDTPLGGGLLDILEASVRCTLDMCRIEQGSVCILVSTDEAIASLNSRYRGKDTPTDVLSFPNTPPILGDIAISLPRAHEQAQELGHPLSRELAFLAAHGTLHLLGYDHDTPEDEAQMINLQQNVLKSLGLRAEQ